MPGFLNSIIVTKAAAATEVKYSSEAMTSDENKLFFGTAANGDGLLSDGGGIIASQLQQKSHVELGSWWLAPSGIV